MLLDAAAQINAQYSQHRTVCSFCRKKPYIPLQGGTGKKAMKKRKRQEQLQKSGELGPPDLEMDYVQKAFQTLLEEERKRRTIVSSFFPVLTTESKSGCVSGECRPLHASFFCFVGGSDASCTTMPRFPS